MMEKPLGLSETEIAALTTRVISNIEENEELSGRVANLVIKALLTNPDIASNLIEGLADRFPQSVLSDVEIKKGIREGYVVIDPLNEERIKTSSYDVSLGEYYWTTRKTHPGNSLFNPHNPKHVRRLWQGPCRAKTIRELLSGEEGKEYYNEDDFEGLKMDDSVVILAPGETILAHTEEFIGGKDKVTSMMKARSSWGRAFLAVCKDAGWGDVGYFNRWTMEIQNNLANEWSVVPVGQPIAQMVFFRVNPVEDAQYSQGGSYQSSSDVEQLRKKWNPEMMLPKLVRKD